MLRREARVFLVTNKHVISEDGRKWKWGEVFKPCLTHRIRAYEPGSNFSSSFDVPMGNISLKTARNPFVDVAVVELTSLPVAKRLKTMDVARLVSFFRVSAMHVGSGDHVFALGHPELVGPAHSFALAKSGFIASLPGQKLTPWRPEPLLLLLIDGSFVGGTSGAPIVLSARPAPQYTGIGSAQQCFRDNHVIGIQSALWQSNGTIAIVFAADYILHILAQFK